MYFPYLRGRQFELIALRELLHRGLLSKEIIPIVEPIRLSSTLIKTVTSYIERGRMLAVIMNPKVGDFFNDIKEEKNKRLAELFYLTAEKNQEHLLFMHLLNEKENPKDFITKYSGNMGTICTRKDAIPIYTDFFIGEDTKYNLIPDESGFRRKIRTKRVLLDDKFNKQERNFDYISIADEAFSEDHLYYREDGYVGFADYSIVGKGYKGTGFAPSTVAIHIVYFDIDKSLRIRHFTSDSNDDIKDPAKKFQEALAKLVAWNHEQKLSTYAMRELERLYREEVYPGLGTVKKLSIMHHIELIGNFLDGGAVI